MLALTQHAGHFPGAFYFIFFVSRLLLEREKKEEEKKEKKEEREEKKERGKRKRKKKKKEKKKKKKKKKRKKLFFFLSNSNSNKPIAHRFLCRPQNRAGVCGVDAIFYYFYFYFLLFFLLNRRAMNFWHTFAAQRKTIFSPTENRKIIWKIPACSWDDCRSNSAWLLRLRIFYLGVTTRKLLVERVATSIGERQNNASGVNHDFTAKLKLSARARAVICYNRREANFSSASH